MSYRTPRWDENRELWQTIRNARPIPARSSQRDLPQLVNVTAWVVWERNGLELIDTQAHLWAGQDVQVELYDPRHEHRYVWLAAQDVRRR